MFPNIEIKISEYATIGNIALGLWYGTSDQSINLKQFDKGVVHELAKPYHINTEDTFNLEWIEKDSLWEIIADKIVPDFIANEVLIGIGKPSKISKDLFEEFWGVLVPTGYFVDVDQVEIIIKKWFEEFFQKDIK